MFSRNRDEHHESGARGGIIPSHTASSLCFFKGTSPRPSGRRRGINISGVDFWHAVEFSRNGRFLCTHPRDSLVAFLRALPFGVSDSIRSFRARFPVGGFSPAGFRLSTSTTLADSLGELIIEFRGFRIQACGHTEFAPAEGEP